MFLKYCRELEKKRRFPPAQHAEVPHARARTHGHAKTGRVKIRKKKTKNVHTLATPNCLKAELRAKCCQITSHKDSGAHGFPANAWLVSTEVRRD